MFIVIFLFKASTGTLKNCETLGSFKYLNTLLFDPIIKLNQKALNKKKPRE